MLVIGCNDSNHGDLSIFNDPTPEQFAEWIAIDSTYIKGVLPMVDLYKESGSYNLNENPWNNNRFQLEYSELTWRGLLDYINYYSVLYEEWGSEKTNKHLDSLNNRYEQMSKDLFDWKLGN